MKHILSIIFLVFLISFVHAQSVPGPFNANGYEDYSDQRNKLNIDIPNLQSQIALMYVNPDYLVNDSNNTEYYCNYFSTLIKNANKSRDSAKLTDSVNVWNVSFNYYNGRKHQLQSSLLEARTQMHKKDSLNLLLDEKKKELSEVEYKLNQMMIPKISQQNFMFWSSIAFVLLMCILLYTFFRVVNKDESVRKIIFGSDSGIQFVTLFSIIIAIILFGLTGVLEGKELSALLGSIAGYILGKAKLANDLTNKTDQSPPVKLDDLKK